MELCTTSIRSLSRLTMISVGDHREVPQYMAQPWLITNVKALTISTKIKDKWPRNWNEISKCINQWVIYFGALYKQKALHKLALLMYSSLSKAIMITEEAVESCSLHADMEKYSNLYLYWWFMYFQCFN